MVSIVVTPSTGAVITAADVKAQCRIDAGDEDSYIDSFLIPTACAAFEQRTRCKLLATTLWQYAEGWPLSGRLDLDWGVVSEVADVRYLAPGGTEVVLPSTAWATLPATAGMTSLYLLPGAQLPSLADHPAAVRINYKAGWALPANVPPAVKTWLLGYVAYLWGFRGDEDKAPPPPERLDIFIADLIRPII